MGVEAALAAAAAFWASLARRSLSRLLKLDTRRWSRELRLTDPAVISIRSGCVSQGLLLATIGVAIGVVIAALGSRFLESLLFGVRGLDPVTFAGACLLFAVVTLVASYVPARRATTVDPMVALRNE